ncbi:zinc finger protein, putative [Bodo saltans]|uniref:Zinc finger protein, putative n=1 Tax=Bodo saltans TaxID=75058 RepID=A0A0S4J8W0_BODSA|nr:zinc finger protein, putative [Bodo saltans]|eukprot:CUG86548.1 zinc finger protein, putative [Bodo saltans]
MFSATNISENISWLSQAVRASRAALAVSAARVKHAVHAGGVRAAEAVLGPEAALASRLALADGAVRGRRALASEAVRACRAALADGANIARRAVLAYDAALRSRGAHARSALGGAVVVLGAEVALIGAEVVVSSAVALAATEIVLACGAVLIGGGCIASGVVLATHVVFAAPGPQTNSTHLLVAPPNAPGQIDPADIAPGTALIVAQNHPNITPPTPQVDVNNTESRTITLVRVLRFDPERVVQATAEQTKCVVCSVNVPDCVLLPCAHQVLCNRCANALNACPICRSDIEVRFNPFLP